MSSKKVWLIDVGCVLCLLWIQEVSHCEIGWFRCIWSYNCIFCIWMFFMVSLYSTGIKKIVWEWMSDWWQDCRFFGQVFEDSAFEYTIFYRHWNFLYLLLWGSRIFCFFLFNSVLIKLSQKMFLGISSCLCNLHIKWTNLHASSVFMYNTVLRLKKRTSTEFVTITILNAYLIILWPSVPLQVCSIEGGKRELPLLTVAGLGGSGW